MLSTAVGRNAAEQLMASKKNCLVVRKHSELATIPITQAANKVRTVPPDHPLIRAARAVGTIFGNE